MLKQMIAEGVLASSAIFIYTNVSSMNFLINRTTLK